MLVIVEGVNGTGKTTLSEALKSAYGLVQLKPFGAFRRGGHWVANGSGSDVLERLGVPFNTPVEDLFIADSIGALATRVDFLLDRSLPSGLAYSDAEPGCERGREMCAVWKRLVEGVKVIPLVLTANHAVASGRLRPDRRIPEARHEWLQRVIGQWTDYMFGPTARIDTSSLREREVLARARQVIDFNMPTDD